MRRQSVFLVLAALILFAGCGVAPSAEALVKLCGADSDSLAKAAVELRYLKESKGANYHCVVLSGNMDLLGQLTQAISACKAVEPPKVGQFTPEMLSDCEITFTSEDGSNQCFYYISQEKLLVYPQITKGKDRDTLRYLYFADDGKLNDMIQAQKQNAILKHDNSVRPFRSLEELKASIDPDELAEQGTELGFEFYTDPAPATSGTACCAYTFKTYAPLPNNSILITTFGKTKTGEQLKLSVVGMTANSYYTKIIVQEPDEALDSVDTGDSDSLESYAILFQKSAIDLKKWIVFVDENNNILDVIIPEDIEGISEVVNTPVKPVENPDDGSADGGEEESEPDSTTGD